MTRDGNHYAVVLLDGDKQEAVIMGSNVYENQRVKELFDARFTVNEILERTGLTIDRIVKAINAPRVRKVQDAQCNARDADPNWHEVV
jgi:hypothetical protein